MAYNITGTAGNDTLNQTTDGGPGTISGLAGDDSLLSGTGNASVAGDSGKDTILLQAGNTGTVFGGSENDCIVAPTGTGSMVLAGNEGADIFNVGDELGRDGHRRQRFVRRRRFDPDRQRGGFHFRQRRRRHGHQRRRQQHGGRRQRQRFDLVGV